MGFKIFPASNKIGRKFQKAIALLSEEEKNDLLKLLRKKPHKGRKRGRFYSYKLPHNNRLLYKINKQDNYVLVVLVGDHREYERYLNKHKK